MRSYSAKLYEELVEQNPEFEKYQIHERRFVEHIPNLKLRTAIELGAGYGRVLPWLSPACLNVVAFEINPRMYEGLEKRVAPFKNVGVIKDNFLHLGQSLKGLDLHKQ